MCMYIFSEEPAMPMIPLGLKETKDIDFQDPFKVSVLHESQSLSFKWWYLQIIIAANLFIF